MQTRILVISGTGKLGSAVVRELRDANHTVRALVRDRRHFAELERIGAEPVQGDLLDRNSLEHACDGVTHVISAVQAFTGKGRNSPRNVDLYGNLRLIDVARKQRVQRFIFVSADIADARSKVDFFRYKQQAEDYLKQSDMDWVVLRPAAFMEEWANIVAGTVATKQVATIFGKGDNPVNFISRADVAAFIARIALEPAVTRSTIELAGPENLTFLEITELFEQHHRTRAKRKHVPVAVMRTLGTVLKPLNPVVARMMRAGVEMATQPQAMDAAPVTRQFPWYRPRTMREWLESTGGSVAVK
jgi:uncharacterized protein YbjT (DUF2867 family)